MAKFKNHNKTTNYLLNNNQITLLANTNSKSKIAKSKCNLYIKKPSKAIYLKLNNNNQLTKRKYVNNKFNNIKTNTPFINNN